MAPDHVPARRTRARARALIPTASRRAAEPRAKSMARRGEVLRPHRHVDRRSSWPQSSAVHRTSATRCGVVGSGHTVKAAERVDVDHETGWVAGAGSVERPSSGVNGFDPPSAVGRRSATLTRARRSTIAPRDATLALSLHAANIFARSIRARWSPRSGGPSTPTAVSGHIDMWLVDHPGHTTMWPPSSAVDRAPRHAARILVVATWGCGPPDKLRLSLSTARSRSAWSRAAL